MTAGREMISPRTRTAFREALVAFPLREIYDMFRIVGFSRKVGYEPWGKRRELVDDYYATADFSSRDDVRMALAAYAEVLDRLDSESETPLLRHLERDGFVRDSDGRFTAAPGRHTPVLGTLSDLAGALDYPRLAEQVDLLVDAAESNPALAVGTAKETIETVCNTILEELGIQPGNRDLARLVRRTAKELALLPDSIPDKAKGAGTIKRLLSNLTQVSQGLAELRNLYGTGHGRGARDQGVHPRHARLAVNAAVTLATFLLETHLARKSKDGQRTAENAQ
jgi:hypothetical protein